jgi:uncharacterized protein YjbI with pentapeptide repeats
MDTSQKPLKSVASSTVIGIAIFVVLTGVTLFAIIPYIDTIFLHRKFYDLVPPNFVAHLISILLLYIFNFCVASFISSLLLGHWQRHNNPNVLLGGISGFIIGMSGPLLLLIWTASPFMLIVMVMFGLPAFIVGLIGYTLGRTYQNWSFKIKFTIGIIGLMGIIIIFPLARYIKGMPLSCPPNCANADLSGYDFNKVVFNNANLSGATLNNADLSQADLMHTNLVGASLVGADLRNADLSGADLRDADLSNASLTGVDLRNVLLNEGTKITDECRLIWEIVNGGGRGRNFTGINLSGANLMRADLSGANLSKSDLSSAWLYGAVLTDSNLEAANLSRSTLTGADLRGANLSKADLEHTWLDDAIYDDRTVWPEGFDVQRSRVIHK